MLALLRATTARQLHHPTDNPRNSRRFIPNLLTIMRATLREHPMSG
jgi:hypothetical protein